MSPPARETWDGRTPEFFHEKCRKKYPPGPKFRTPGIYQKNTPKIPPKYQKCAFFWAFSPVFWGYFLGVPESSALGYFFGIFVEIPGRTISGLSSRSGRSQGQRKCFPFLFFFPRFSLLFLRFLLFFFAFLSHSPRQQGQTTASLLQT